MELPNAIKNENNPEVLRAYFSFLLQDIEKLRRKVNYLEAKKAESIQLALDLDDQLLLLRKRMFGKSSEKRGTSRPRGKERRPLSVHCESLVPPPKEEEMEQLVEIQVDHKLSPEELSDIAEEYGFARDSEWECLNGLYDKSEEVDIHVESYTRKRHRRFKYRLKKTKGSEGEVIVTAPAPVKIMPGAKYSIDFAVDIVAKKYLYHLPLERIRRIMESGGLKISTNTLYNLCFFVHCYLEDLALRVKDEILGTMPFG